MRGWLRGWEGGRPLTISVGGGLGSQGPSLGGVDGPQEIVSASVGSWWY